MKHCVTNTKNIKRQNEKNLIFKRNVVVVEKKCDSNLSDCLNEKKKKMKKTVRKKYKKNFRWSKKKRREKTKINNFSKTNNLSNITLIFIIALFSNFWQSASILNQFIMNVIEFFFWIFALNWRLRIRQQRFFHSKVTFLFHQWLNLHQWSFHYQWSLW